MVRTLALSNLTGFIDAGFYHRNQFNHRHKAANVTAVSRPSLAQQEFLKPRYWPTWLLVFLGYLICLTPLRVRWAIGGGLGRAGYHLAARRRHIVETNLQLCFPELSKRQLKQLAKDNFVSSGISLIETAVGWFVSAEKYIDLVDFENLELLLAAQKEEKGILLLGMHLSTLDFAGSVLGMKTTLDVMYRKNKNQLIETVMKRGREKHFPSAIERDDIRQVIRRLKKGATVWYGADQDYGIKHSVFAPFYGIQAATITAPLRLIKMTDANVLVLSHYRDLKNGRYRVVITKMPDHYPSGDDVLDCTLYNQVVERCVSQAPEQYWWLHRRFKTRPEGESRPY